MKAIFCPTCKVIMLRCKYGGGGVYYYCTQCGCRVESTAGEEE